MKQIRVLLPLGERLVHYRVISTPKILTLVAFKLTDEEATALKSLKNKLLELQFLKKHFKTGLNLRNRKLHRVMYILCAFFIILALVPIKSGERQCGVVSCIRK